MGKLIYIVMTDSIVMYTTPIVMSFSNSTWTWRYTFRARLVSSEIGATYDLGKFRDNLDKCGGVWLNF